MPPPLWSLSYSSQQQRISFSSTDHMAFLMAQTVKRLPTMKETQVRSLGREDSLEKEMATHSSTLAWKIPWMEEPGRLHTVHGVAKSRTQLSDFTFFHFLQIRLWYFIYASPTKIKHEKWAIIFQSHFNHKFHIPVGKISESLLYPTAQYNTLFLAGIWCIIDVAAKLLQSCPTLCDPIDGSPPGSPVPGILQARTLEWVAISFSNARKWKRSHSVVSNS